MANPAYDAQIDQIDEVSRLKVELARDGVMIDVDTLKRGMVLPEREDPPNEGPKRYLRGDEYLLKNPFKKKKKNKDSKKVRRGSIKKAGRSGSPRKSPRRRRAGSAGSSDDMTL